jgi:O-antigen/teichoic acid export membrane protein
MSSWPTQRTVAGNTVLNVVGALLPIGMAVATVPLYLNTIGAARYGLLTLVWIFVGYFGVGNVGLSRAIGNRIAKLRTSPPRERQRVFWTALVLGGTLGVVGGALVMAVGSLLVAHVLELSPEVRHELSSGLPWLALGVVFSNVARVCIGALEGLESFGIVNGLEVASGAIYQLAPLTVAWAFGPSLTWLAAAAAAAPVVMSILALAACARRLPLSRRIELNRGSAASLLRYGGWVTVSEIVGPLLTVLDRFVIAAVSGPRPLARYAIPFGVVTRLWVFPFGLARALFPRFSRATGSEANALARRATVGLAALMTPLVVVGIFVAEPLLRLWLGGSMGAETAGVAEILLVGVWVNSLAFVPSTLLQARGRPDLPAKLHLAELPPYVAGLWIALSVGGVEGAALVWALRAAVDAALLAAASRIYYRRDLAQAAPLVLVLVAYAAVSAYEPSVSQAALTGCLVLAAFGWSWYAAAGRFDLRARVLRPSRVPS